MKEVPRVAEEVAGQLAELNRRWNQRVEGELYKMVGS